MFLSPLQNALLFSIHTIFNTYIIIVLFRFMLQLVRGDFYNPLAKLAIKLTNPLLIPLRKVIPGYGKIDFASLVLALILQAVELYLVLLINGFSIAPEALSIGGLFIWSLGELFDLFLVFMLGMIIIQVVFSWIQPGQYNSNIMLFERMTEPVVNPVRRILPDMGMLDFSPLIVMFLIYLSRILIASPLIAYGRGLI